MLSDYLLPISPHLMRFYRTRIMLDLPAILAFIPEKGQLLDVGCGPGLLDYAIASRRPGLDILGVDIDRQAIRLAEKHNSLRNLRFAAVPLGEVRGSFDCISFVDVMHHVQEEEAQGMLGVATSLLTSAGRIFIKDISKTGGWVSYALDRYVSRTKTIRLVDLEEMLALASHQFRVVTKLQKYRFPFPNYYIELVAASDSAS